MGIESQYWEDIMHPDDLEILKELEDLVGETFDLQHEEMVSNWKFPNQGIAKGPGLQLDPDDRIIAVNLSDYQINDLRHIIITLQKLPYLTELYLDHTG